MNGDSRGMMLIVWSASRKTTSIGNCMNAVWIDQAGREAHRGRKAGRASRAGRRGRRIVESQTVTDSATTRPSVAAQCQVGSAAHVSCPPLEHFHDADHHRHEQDDEECRHDQEGIGKRIFTGAFCARSSA